MYKFYSFISLLFFSTISLGMERSIITPESFNNKSLKNQIISYNPSYGARIDDQRKKQERNTLPTIYKSVKSSGITKPHNMVEQKKQLFPFIYDKYTATRGKPKMLNIYCNDCKDLLIKYQKDGPGRLLRCYLDRIHSPSSLKNRQYEHFNTSTSPYLSCQTCRLIIGTPMIYQSEARPAYRMDARYFYMKDDK